MHRRKHRVCPAQSAWAIDNRVRKWFQDPRKILDPYIKEGMKVLDFGCGSGFFSVEMAKLVGERGLVIAADIQDGMLHKLGNKIKGTIFEGRIQLHKCEEDRIGIQGPVDMAFAFYVMHEVPDQKMILAEMKNILKPEGFLLIVEPKYLHVTEADFSKTVDTALALGFEHAGTPKIFFGRAVALNNRIMAKSNHATTA